MSRKPNITEQIADRIAEKAAEKVLESTAELNGGPASTSTTEKLTDDEQKAGNEFDLFDYCDNYVNQGADAVNYCAYKNGALLCSREHPWSWKEIQEEFGGGVYRVQAKSVKFNRYIKQQTMRLHTPPGGVKPGASVTEFAFSQEAASAAPAQAAIPQGPSITEVMALMQAQNEQARQQARESREQLMSTVSEIAKSFAPILAAFVTPRSSSSGGSEPGNFEMMKMMFDMVRESQRSGQEQIRLMIDEMKRTQPQVAQPTNPYELLAKMRADEEGLLERAIKLQDILNDKAAEIAESRASNGGGEEKEEDTIKLVLKALIPMAGAIGQQLVLNKATQAAPAAPPTPQPTTAMVPRQAPTPQPKPQAAPAMRPISHEATVSVTPQKPKPAAVITMKKPEERPAAPVTAVASAPQPSKESMSVKEQIVREVVPYLQKVLMKMAVGSITPAAVAAEESLKILAAKGITREIAMKEFTKEDLFVVVRTYKLPETVYPWFNEYYAYLGGTTAMESGK